MSATQIDFAQLFRDHYHSVYRYVRYRVDEDSVAEDLTSEIFERAFRAHTTFNPQRAAFSTWIGQIAHNHVTNYLVSRSRRQAHEFVLSESDRLVSTELTPEAQLVKREAVQRLWGCLKLLSDRDREIIALRFGADIGNKGIAERLGLKERSVSVIILRALERLRGCQERI